MSTRLVLSIVSTLVWETILVGLALVLLPIYDIVIPLSGLIVLMVLLLIVAVVSYRIGTQALGRQPLVGLPCMVGSHGRVVRALAPCGAVLIKGEIWEAVSTDDRLDTGEEVTVVGHDRLRLTVDRMKKPDARN